MIWFVLAAVAFVVGVQVGFPLLLNALLAVAVGGLLTSYVKRTQSK